MNYQYIVPPARLRDYVKYFWTLDSAKGQCNPLKFATVADGSPGLIFQVSMDGFAYQDEKQLPIIYLYGQTTTCSQILSPASFQAIGVYFYPHALKSVFGLDAWELTDNCLDLTLFSTLKEYNLIERLLNLSGVSQRIEVLCDYLYKLILLHNSGVDNKMKYTLANIKGIGKNLSLKQLQQDLGWSERTLERKFKEQVGISPKSFAKITQFQMALNMLRSENYSKLTDVAYENFYADQSHFIRSFKEFTSLTPNQYLRNSEELVINFPQIFI
ncbi:helix-turn-helix transcriptional regulator [Olivibacter domesticus]|uniref:AraC-type DNA-binding protein n=1 Tax=Olivibacter domesticus TaxID=407022 RepID=A0A1H7M5A9_OLID1|nr:helix-turn-helix transcriptional regulator [Olivibacter domesticus]SEL06384.1 AraC-type DNA-binding protein [Olivibacter domesticus]